jgi:hypothetical protein
MKIRGRLKLPQRLIAALSILLSLLLNTHIAAACSWDYSIWMIRSKRADPLYRFIQNGKAGYIDRSGKVVIEPRFEFSGNHGGEFHDGLLDVSFDQSGYADTKGKTVIDKQFSWSEDFSEGLALVKPKGGDTWSFIDRTGEVSLVPRLEGETDLQPGTFSEGLAVVTVNKRNGYIDRSGRFVIPPKFSWPPIFKRRWR